MRTPPAPFLLLVSILLAGCALPGDAPEPEGGAATLVPCLDRTQGPAAPSPDWRAEKPIVRLTTTKGALVFALEREGAPATVENFLTLARTGFYNDMPFHRLVPGFILQGGDPLSRDDDPSNDGLGGSDPIADEFNPELRHDAPGVISMANAGPDTGSSQFFVTLDAARHLDDRHAVFGRLVEGHGTLDALARTPADATGRPQERLDILDARVLDPAPFNAIHGLALHPVLDTKTTAGGHNVTFVLVARNEGNVRDEPRLRVLAPRGWTCQAEESVPVAAGTARAILLELRPPTEAEGPARIEVEAASAWDGTPAARTNLTADVAGLGRKVAEGDTLSVDYVTLLRDGRVFGTNLAAVADDAAQPKLDTPGGFAGIDPGPLAFTVGPACRENEPADCVLPGFERVALGAFVGETAVGVLEPSEAWETGNVYENPVVQREVVLELRILPKT